MTTQQDSVDVERAAIVAYLEACAVEADRQADLLSVAGRARAIEACQEEAKAYRNSARMIRNEDYASYRHKVAALSLPITQRDEQAKTYADGVEDAAKLCDEAAAKARFFANGMGVAANVETGRVREATELAAAIRRLSIEQGDQDGGAA